jgi:hypothetical protein
MGHCGKFGYALWATATNLVVRYWPLRHIWLYAMSHCGGFGYELWATMRYEVAVKICYNFCAMGHSAGFGYGVDC